MAKKKRGEPLPISFQEAEHFEVKRPVTLPTVTLGGKKQTIEDRTQGLHVGGGVGYCQTEMELEPLCLSLQFKEVQKLQPACACRPES